MAEPSLPLVDPALLWAALGRGQAHDGEALQMPQVAGGVQGQPLLELPHRFPRGRPAWGSTLHRQAAHSACD